MIGTKVSHCKPVNLYEVLNVMYIMVSFITENFIDNKNYAKLLQHINITSWACFILTLIMSLVNGWNRGTSWYSPIGPQIVYYCKTLLRL